MSDANRDELRLEHDRLYDRAVAILQDEIILENDENSRLGWMGRRRIKSAITLLERVLEMNSANWPALWLLGKAFERLDDPDQSLDYLSRAHELAPDDPNVAREAGIAAMNARRPELAIYFTSQAIEVSPEDAGLCANLALAHLFSGDAQTAYTVAKDALTRDPDDAITQHIVAVAHDVVTGKRSCPEHINEI